MPNSTEIPINKRYFKFYDDVFKLYNEDGPNRFKDDHDLDELLGSKRRRELWG